MLADECLCLAGAPGRVGIRRVPGRLVGAEHPDTRSDVARPALEALPVASIHGPVGAIDAGDDTGPRHDRRQRAGQEGRLVRAKREDLEIRQRWQRDERIDEHEVRRRIGSRDLDDGLGQ